MVLIHLICGSSAEAFRHLNMRACERERAEAEGGRFVIVRICEE